MSKLRRTQEQPLAGTCCPHPDSGRETGRGASAFQRDQILHPTWPQSASRPAGGDAQLHGCSPCHPGTSEQGVWPQGSQPGCSESATSFKISEVLILIFKFRQVLLLTYCHCPCFNIQKNFCKMPFQEDAPFMKPRSALPPLGAGRHLHPATPGSSMLVAGRAWRQCGCAGTVGKRLSHPCHHPNMQTLWLEASQKVCRVGECKYSPPENTSPFSHMP